MNPNVKALIQELIKIEIKEGAHLPQNALRDLVTDIRHYAHEEKLNMHNAVSGSGEVWVDEMMPQYEIGESVDVMSPPTEDMCWSHEFRGVVRKVSLTRRMRDYKDYYEGYCSVEDMDGNVFDIDFEFLHPVREEEGSKQLPSNVIEGYCVMASGDLGYSDEYTYYSKEKHILEGIVNEVIKDAPDLEIKAATLIIKED